MQTNVFVVRASAAAAPHHSRVMFDANASIKSGNPTSRCKRHVVKLAILLNKRVYVVEMEIAGRPLDRTLQRNDLCRVPIAVPHLLSYASHYPINLATCASASAGTQNLNALKLMAINAKRLRVYAACSPAAIALPCLRHYLVIFCWLHQIK